MQAKVCPFFQAGCGPKSAHRIQAWLCRGSTMDVELLAAQPQLQPAGRGDRVARTREAIVSSTLTLAMEGEVAPIVRDIAKLAGVSARTVFQHFADTAELYVAVLGRVLTGGRSDGHAAAPAAALDERIHAGVGPRPGGHHKVAA